MNNFGLHCSPFSQFRTTRAGVVFRVPLIWSIKTRPYAVPVFLRTRVGRDHASRRCLPGPADLVHKDPALCRASVLEDARRTGR
ncbi:hypothetical protein NDU88_003681 [Pleurodeles waltl]|uniref:Uncharacterized protein n=1 Tax=Pleurodeles waltl TaxID=8319 RepID=A0AAV7REZ0_PLEWA|nr:hypothetical protein NDU88_003681 [Pleurodeles waltl]